MLALVAGMVRRRAGTAVSTTRQGRAHRGSVRAGRRHDIQARLIGQKLAESLGVPVIVDNKPGASTVIGSREVAKAPPDGHTLLYTIAIITQLQHLYKTPPFDLFKEFTPLTAGASAAPCSPRTYRFPRTTSKS